MVEALSDEEIINCIKQQNKTPIESQTLQEKIVTYIGKIRVGISFAELNRLDLEGTRGVMALYPGEYENLIIWMNMSDDYFKIIQRLLELNLIELVPCHSLVYFVDGVVPPLAIAKSKRHYKNPRWVPTSIKLSPKGMYLVKHVLVKEA